MTQDFAIDRRNAKLMGVCAGFANWTGWNVLAVRIGLVALTLLALGPVTILAYLIIGWAAQD